jgi:hypothetical protein
MVSRNQFAIMDLRNLDTAQVIDIQADIRIAWQIKTNPDLR